MAKPPPKHARLAGQGLPAAESSLPAPARTIALEQIIEREAEAAPLPASELPPDVADVGSGGFSLKDRLLNFKSLLSFAVAFAVIGIAIWRADIDLNETWARMRAINPWLYSAGFVIFYSTFPLRAWRWRLILRSAGFEVDTPEARRNWSSIAHLSEFLGLSWFANCVVPAKLGDAYRGYLLKKNGNASFSRTLGTIFAERIIDMLVLFGMLVVSGLLIFQGQIDDNEITSYLFIVGILLTIILIVGLMSMRYLSPLIRRVIPERFHEFYARFEEGTLASFRPRVLPGLAALTILVWIGEAMRLFFVIEAMGGLDLTLSMIIFVALASSLLTAVPALPGGLGLVELGIVGVLTTPLFNVAASTGGAVALLDRVINYWSIVLLGFILYLFSKRK